MVQGGFGTVTVVPVDDRRLLSEGVPGVRVQLVRDPTRMSREVVCETTSGSDGTFLLETKTFGAGWMDERWELIASSQGFQGAQSYIELPHDPSTRRLVIEIPRGASLPADSKADTNLFDEAKQFDSKAIGNKAGPN